MENIKANDQDEELDRLRLDKATYLLEKCENIVQQKQNKKLREFLNNHDTSQPKEDLKMNNAKKAYLERSITKNFMFISLVFVGAIFCVMAGILWLLIESAKYLVY